MDLGVISVRYARALLKCALQQKIENNVYEDMQNLYNSYLQVPELRQTVDNPMLQKEQKRHHLLRYQKKGGKCMRNASAVRLWSHPVSCRS